MDMSIKNRSDIIDYSDYAECNLVKEIIIKKKSISTVGVPDHGLDLVFHFKGVVAGLKFKHIVVYTPTIAVCNSGNFRVGASLYNTIATFKGFKGINKNIFKLINSGDRESLILGAALLNRFIKGK